MGSHADEIQSNVEKAIQDVQAAKVILEG